MQAALVAHDDVLTTARLEATGLPTHLGEVRLRRLLEEIAERAVLLLLLFPTSFFLTAFYTEGLFLLLTVGAFLAARRGRWAVAGALATLSISLTGTSATQNTALSGYAITTTGGTGPYTCATTPASGSLPAGVTLASNCALSGTPTASGTSTFTVTVSPSSDSPLDGDTEIRAPFEGVVVSWPMKA